MDAVQGVADRVLVLIEGRLVAQGRFDQVAADPVVQARYLGRSHEGRCHA
jgi:branched-chain amino acid transport system ATP-binding protein